MAFGIPGSETTASGEFLGRIQYDARTGFWQTVKRVQGVDGLYADDKSEPFKGVSFLVDFGSLEVGYIKLSSPPAFLLVPEGQMIPTQPAEMQTVQGGAKPRKAFQPGFRVKLMSPKTFGDEAAYYFANSSKTVMEPMDKLYTTFKGCPEAATGQIPIVQVAKTAPVQVKTPQGTNTFYAPVFEIIGWADRPEVFGDRTVSAPAANGQASVASAAPHKPVANHAPPPAAVVAAAPAPASAGMPAF